MDPEVTSNGTSVSTETIPKPTDVTEQGPEICPPANADATATADAADSPNMCENVADDENMADEKVPILRPRSWPI